MLFASTRSLIVTLVKRFCRIPMNMVPEGRLKFWARAAIARCRVGIAPEFLVSPGESVVLVGFHRIDSVMLWSYLVGPRGRVVVVEAVPDYVENIRQNLEHHLNWPLRNVLYVAKGVDAKPGETRIQIGTVADYNKLSGQSIDDGLTDGSYARELTVETDTLDNILAQLDLREVHHIHMTISGMEVEALKGMEQILSRSGLRVHIRSLHSKDGALLYPEVVKRLREHGMKAVVGQHTAQFQGADVYAAKV